MRFLSILLFFTFIGCISQTSISLEVKNFGHPKLQMDINYDGIPDFLLYEQKIQEKNISAIRYLYVFPYDILPTVRNVNISENLSEIYCSVPLQGKDTELLRELVIKYNQYAKTPSPITLPNLYVLYYAIKYHPLSEKYGCIPKFAPILKEVAGFSTVSYGYLLIYNINTTASLNITEVIPEEIGSGLVKLNLPEGGRQISITPRVIQILAKNNTAFYFVSTKLSPTYIENWQTTIVVTKINAPLATKFLSLLHIYYVKITSLIGMPYFSFGLLLAALWIAITIIFGFLEYLFSIIIEHKSLKEALGYADPDAIKKAVIGLIFLVISIWLEIEVKNKPLDSFDLLLLKELAVEDYTFPLISISALLGTVLIVDFLKDLTKGLIKGDEYYRYVKQISRKGVKVLFAHLNDRVKQTYEKLKELSEANIDVSEEISKLNEIPLKTLKARIEKEDPETIYRDLKNYEKVLAALEEKLSKYLEEGEKLYAEKWKTYIHTALLAGETEIDLLTNIPKQWRMWAINRFLREHPAYYLEGKMIKRIVDKFELLDRILLLDPRVKAYYIRKGEKKSLKIKEGVKTQTAILLSKILSKGGFLEGEKLSIKTIQTNSVKAAILTEKMALEEIEREIKIRGDRYD